MHPTFSLHKFNLIKLSQVSIKTQVAFLKHLFLQMPKYSAPMVAVFEPPKGKSPDDHLLSMVFSPLALDAKKSTRFMLKSRITSYTGSIK